MVRQSRLERMVGELARVGGLSLSVLEAMRRVPRSSFVPPGTPDDETYDLDRAVALTYDPASPALATSTVSAPRIVAVMLELLSLRGGERVLEIGTGSGYNAALLASLVGDGSLVTTVDIDASLIASARERLSSVGWGDVVATAGDGWAGVAERAPYDRIVATVGVADVAPAWVAQLAPGGCLLLPLHHGGVHPIVRVTADAAPPPGPGSVTMLDSGALSGSGAPSGPVAAPGAVRGRVVARSGFVPIRGHQASRAPWRHAGSALAHEPVPGARVDRLPAPLRDAGRATRLDRTTPWDFSYWLAMVDDRTSNLCTLVDDDGSVAVVDLVAGLVSSVGPTGAGLRDTLLDRAREWIALGSPRAESWHSTFVPLADAGNGAAASEPGERRYVIRRVDHAQVVTQGGTTVDSRGTG